MSIASFRIGIVSLSLFVLCGFLFKTLQPQNQVMAAPQMMSASPAAASKALVRAPEFPANADWLNTDKPLSISGLKGKVVLLDFWTYCCINCMHILPDLKKLERKYPNELVVIGVHSAKFENEGETQNIRNAIMRYKIEHPVLNDKTMRVWNEYAVRAWPTLVLIDPNGRIVSQLAGEGHYETLDQQIGELVQQFKARGELNSTPLKFALESAKRKNTPLSYPGKVLADASSNRLFIADSSHNRIIVSDLNGIVQSTFGSGVQGFNDGDSTKATFHNPQGMALSEDGKVLFVADTDNHAIRALDLVKKKVTTLAGTGKQAAWRLWGGVGTQAALASPWDVLRVESTLYIAMAGTHQIWSMDLNTKQITPYAGSGAEARYDATLVEAALAQPSGLATDGKVLFFADSESSSIRSASLPDNGDAVKTVVGGDTNSNNLFAFGDQDGKGFEAKLQHPLGVAVANGVLYVADTYNHKIKTLNPLRGEIRTLWGGRDKLSEPGGLSATDDRLYIADTNNHRIQVLHFKSGNAGTLALKGLPAALSAEPQRVAESTIAGGVMTLPMQTLAPSSKGEIIFDVKFPKGFHLNKQAPQKWQGRVEGTGLALSKNLVKNFSLPLRVNYSAGGSGAGTVVMSSDIYYCTDDMGVCKMQPVKVRAPFKLATNGAKALRIHTQIDSKDKVLLASASEVTKSGVTKSAVTNSGETKMAKLVKSDEEWKQELTPEQFSVLRQKGTERAFTGALLENHKNGVYKCAACGEELFASDTKFDSGSGWPSFYQPISTEKVEEEDDASFGMRRVEALCARCESHLGHVFDDGPKPTGLRYCINSAALQFEEEK